MEALDIQGSERVINDILLIFPIAPSIWEPLVKASYLEKLIASKSSDLTLAFREPSKLPKGIVGRTAQIRSVAQPEDRWVWWIYMSILE